MFVTDCNRIFREYVKTRTRCGAFRHFGTLALPMAKLLSLSLEEEEEEDAPRLASPNGIVALV